MSEEGREEKAKKEERKAQSCEEEKEAKSLKIIHLQQRLAARKLAARQRSAWRNGSSRSAQQPASFNGSILAKAERNSVA